MNKFILAVTRGRAEWPTTPAATSESVKPPLAPIEVDSRTVNLLESRREAAARQLGEERNAEFQQWREAEKAVNEAREQRLVEHATSFDGIRRLINSR